MSYKADIVAEEIMDELNGRSGYDNIWDDLGSEIKKDILDTIINILEDHYETA